MGPWLNLDWFCDLLWPRGFDGCDTVYLWNRVLSDLQLSILHFGILSGNSEDVLQEAQIAWRGHMENRVPLVNSSSWVPNKASTSLEGSYLGCPAKSRPQDAAPTHSARSRRTTQLNPVNSQNHERLWNDYSCKPLSLGTFVTQQQKWFWEGFGRCKGNKN